jgi:hypothetical protein
MSSSSGVGGSSANVSVSPASLTFSAVNASSVFGSEAAVLNYTVSGFVFGQTLSQLYSGSPSLNSSGAALFASVGSYPITITSGNLTCIGSCSYTFVGFVSGTYEVTAGEQLMWRLVELWLLVVVGGCCWLLVVVGSCGSCGL